MNVVGRIYWRYWEVIIFYVWMVSYVVVFKFFIRVLFCFCRVDFVERIGYVSVEFNIIE